MATGSRQPNEFLQPGTHVLYEGGNENEYGVVVHCWWDEQMREYDCYVAFFGASMPADAPRDKPYVLRYFSASLTKVDGP